MNDHFRFPVLSSSPLETHNLGELLGRAIRFPQRPGIGERPPTTGALIGLVGELGAGKTTFTQGLARGLDVHARITSPTFTLINEYISISQDLHLFHVDSYRLAGDSESLAGEMYGLGMDEILDILDEEPLNDRARPTDPAPMRHVVVIEWADRLSDLLPADRLMVRFASAADEQSSLVTDQTRLTHDLTGGRMHMMDGNGSERTLSFCATGPHSGALLAEMRTAMDPVQRQDAIR